ncbi:MAG: glycoside hydrolase family 3 N-terminal domain-containing protein [Pseudomonadota bacterium]
MNQLAAAVIAGSLEGKELTRDEIKFMESMPHAGLTIFGRNIDQDHHEALSSLCQKIQNGSSLRRLIMIDQEGGRVARLKANFPNPGASLDLEEGSDSSESLTRIRSYGQTVGYALRELGINVNFAPVADILTEPTNTAIGNRVWGVEALPALNRSRAWLEGLQSTGILGCIKHFPGQGDAKLDTHLSEAVIDLPASVLESRELVPFRGLMGISPMVMISHCIYPAYDTKPASLSKVIMSDLLRRQMGFEGVIVSDDMTMGAIPADEKSWGEAIVTAIAHGADLILVCQKLELWRVAIQFVSEEAKKSKAFAEILTSAAHRVSKMRERLAC